MIIDPGFDNFADEIPKRAWLLRRLPLSSRKTVEWQSQFFGLCGLGVLFVVVGIGLPIAMKAVEIIFDSRPTSVVMLIIYQVILFPATIVFAFAIVACLFRGGSLAKNYLIAVLITLPGPIAFVIAMETIAFHFGEQRVKAMAMVLFAFYVAAGFLATICQLWTRWTLVSLDLSDKPITRAGTRALIELTAIAAVLCAIAMTLETAGIMIGILLFASLGFLSSSAIISFLVGFAGGNQVAKVASIILVFGSALTLCGTMAAVDLQWTMSPQNAIPVVTASIAGSLILLAMMSVCLVWLRACGWQCVK